MKQLVGTPDRTGVRERTEVAAAIFAHAPRDQQARELLAQRETKIGVGLVVPHQHIVRRAVLFDEIAFQNQGFQLAVGNNPLQIGDSAHHAGDFGGLLCRLLEIGTHPLAQVDRLAHIQHGALRIFENIASRLLRKRLELRLQVCGHQFLLYPARLSGRLRFIGTALAAVGRSLRWFIICSLS
ncbi:hypothetical protein HRbin14_01504 [bacterium HR14]|nr:hypothetical protein HRbin14_01504 [bacterium HR14]